MVPLQYQLLSFDVSGSQVPVLSAALVFVDRATENSQRDPQKRVVRRPLCPFMPLFSSGRHMATCNSWLWQVLNLHIAWICMDLWDKRRNTSQKTEWISVSPYLYQHSNCSPLDLQHLFTQLSHVGNTGGTPGCPRPQHQTHAYLAEFVLISLHLAAPQTLASRYLHTSPCHGSSVLQKWRRDSIHFHPKTAPTWNPTMLFATILSTGAGGPIKLLTSWPTVGLLLDSCSQKGSQKGSLSQASCMGDHLFRPTRPSGSLLSFYQLSVSNTWSHS